GRAGTCESKRRKWDGRAARESGYSPTHPQSWALRLECQSESKEKWPSQQTGAEPDRQLAVQYSPDRPTPQIGVGIGTGRHFFAEGSSIEASMVFCCLPFLSTPPPVFSGASLARVSEPLPQQHADTARRETTAKTNRVRIISRAFQLRVGSRSRIACPAEGRGTPGSVVISRRGVHSRCQEQCRRSRHPVPGGPASSNRSSP